MKISDIRIRDPYILLDGDKYYMYGTTRMPEDGYDVGTFGFDVYVSSDLSEFEGPYPVFEQGKEFFGISDYWAPEVYKIGEEYFMSASFKGNEGLHGVGILSSKSPLGPFTPHSEMPITPKNWAAIDGTLYFEDGKPYMIFVHEWSQIGDGTMCYAELSEDLKRFAGDPVFMLRASENPFGRASRRRDGSQGYITDGPCMHKCENGDLLMLWSMRGERGYIECIYHSDNGRLSGSFKPKSLLFGEDGGHGMLFCDKENKLKFVLHTPNTRGEERAKIYDIADIGGDLILK